MRVIAIVSVLALADAAHGQPITIAHKVGLHSSLVLRGLQLSDGDRPVVVLSADAYASSGWSLGAALTALRSGGGDAALGWTLRGGVELPLDDTWSLSFSGRHDNYLGSAWMRTWCYNQLDAALSHADLWSVSWSWRPRHGPGCDNPPGIADRAVDAVARWPLSDAFGVVAGVGRLSGAGAASYGYGHWALTFDKEGWMLAAGRSYTAGIGSAELRTLAGRHWVASAVWKF